MYICVTYLTQMKVRTIISCFLLVVAFNANSQSSTDIWYVWIDTQVTIDGQPKRLMNEKPFRINCCVKSSDFRKLNKKVAKFIRAEYDPDYDARIVLKSIQDPSFAELMIRKAKDNNNIVWTNYSASCD